MFLLISAAKNSKREELEARKNGKWGHIIENVANAADAASSAVNIGTSIYR